MAKKRATVRDADDTPDASEPAQETHDPTQWVGLDHGRTGAYVYVEVPADPMRPEGSTGRDRAITVDGQRFEHCAVDADGCWLYRHAHQ